MVTNNNMHNATDVVKTGDIDVWPSGSPAPYQAGHPEIAY
jgi:hypothetical protein